LAGSVPNPEFRILLGAVSARSAGPGSEGSDAFRGSLPRLASAEAGEALAALPGLLWERIARLDLAAFAPPPSDAWPRASRIGCQLMPAGFCSGQEAAAVALTAVG